MRWLDPSEDSVEEALRQALDAAQARTGDEIARRRVWTRIVDPGRPFRAARWLTRLALIGTLTASAAGAVLVWPRSTGHEQPLVSAAPPPVPAPAPVVRAEPREPEALARTPLIEGPRVLRPKARRKVRLIGNAEVELEPNSVLTVDRRQRASIERGRVSLAVAHQPPGQHFSIGAGPCMISVLGTKFHVRVAGKSVGVDVDEGTVEVWSHGRKYTVGPGDSWTSPESAGRGRRVAVRETANPRGPTPKLRPSAPPVMPNSGPFREVQAALAEGHPQKALEILEVTSRGDGPEAENAAYEVGWLLRDRLVHPRQALAAWDRYRARFPRGLLRPETDLSVLETMLMLGDATGALAEAKAFLDRHPTSERRAEITRVVRALRGDPAETPPPAQAPGDPGVR
jgi:FecR-like protein